MFAKKIILANVRLLATAGILLLFFALVDRIPDDSVVLKERGFQSAQSLRTSPVASEPGIVGATRFLGRDYFNANCHLTRELPPEIILSFDSVTGISLAADSSPPVS